ncbi:MAG TPA: hypothetical protein VE954_35715 [Oligoflexus sp.]|uniref:hypothetical protein n=1 Tax=Oligoflexus sp. TaxID=1971216 RepID=UPI002D4F665D|nr:hypothetical protein [Oligoflexus sp.]HYX38481.1 hypothetical protein [Oligoflexus sp.]
MSRDKHSGSDPELPMSAEDEAFLRLVEDSYEAAGRPQDQAGADRIWGKLEARMAAEANPQPAGSVRDAQVHFISTARKRRGWVYVSSALSVAAALVLFVNFNPTATEEDPGTMQTRGAASGFTAAIKVYDDHAQAPAGSRHHVRVKATADADGFVALFRQLGEGAPVFVSTLGYKKELGELHILEEDAEPGTRYCVVGAKDQDGLKHLVELIPDLWAYLPNAACHSIP